MLIVNLDTTVACLGRKSIQVVDLKEASARLRAYVERYNFGSSDVGKNFGLVKSAGAIVARVSYNGRIWNHYTGKEIVP